ncbi:hypothetical protein C1H46_040106 [Malus baccata]|uniref:alpha-galactosidase n=1 Tax=Malus baccata TaxID=106549 RepID=A0A540KJI6_MALBA|nr:hypothetical protein C1H46_040106 [Malus baccata]
MEKDGGDRDNAALVTLIVMLLIMAMGVSSASSASAAAASSQLRRNMLANGLGLTPPMGFPVMTRALMKAGRPIFYSLCECMVSRADMNEVYAEFARPGGWNGEYSFRLMEGAPLLLGCNVGNITKETMDIIANKEVISVNQADPLGVQAKKVRLQGNREVWAGPLSGYRVALLLVNRSRKRDSFTAHWDDIGIPTNSVVEARDLWETYQCFEVHNTDLMEPIEVLV